MAEEFTENCSDYDEIIHYKVENEITLQVRNTTETALATYVLVLEVNSDRKKIILNREDFKINNNEVTNKFPYISMQYMNAIFPIKLGISKDKLEVSNAEEIIKNINNVDEKLQREYQGKGFDHIRNEFLNITNTKQKVNDFVSNFNFIKVIELTLLENQKKNKLKMDWPISPYKSDAFFELTSESDENSHYGDIQNQKEVIESIISFSEKNNLNLQLNPQPDYFQGEFYQEMRDFETNFNFDFVRANFVIAVDNSFAFEEKITLQNIY